MLKKNVPFLLDVMIHVLVALLMVSPVILFSSAFEIIGPMDPLESLTPIIVFLLFLGVLSFFILKGLMFGAEIMREKYNMSVFYVNYRANFWYFFTVIVGVLYIIPPDIFNNSIFEKSIFSPFDIFLRVACFVGISRFISNNIVYIFGERGKSELSNWFCRKMKK